MRFVTSAKYLVGFAVATAVASALGGSAWASEGSSSIVTSGGNITVSNTQESVTVEGSSRTESSVVSSTSQASHDAASTVTLASSEVAETVAGASVALPSVPSEPQVEQISQTVSQTTDASVGSSSAAAELVAEPTAVTIDDSGRTVVFEEQALPVQPAIISQTTSVSDLASHVPSAPATTHSPLPVKSTSVLSTLTDQLSSLVNPLEFVLAGAALRSSLAVASALAALILLGFAFASFAGRLKLTGFVHAARSDVANSHLNFATPFNTGYVTSTLRSHNPFLLVSDTKTYQGFSS